MFRKLSVIIPLYNHERYISEAIYSVLGQSFGDFELIIINDGSTDNSEEVVRANEETDFIRRNWKDFFEAGDPYYNPNLTLENTDFSIRV